MKLVECAHGCAVRARNRGRRGNGTSRLAASDTASHMSCSVLFFFAKWSGADKVAKEGAPMGAYFPMSVVIFVSSVFLSEW